MMKYANQLVKGDTIMVTTDELKVVKSVEHAGSRNVCIMFEDKCSLITAATTHLPVIQSKVNESVISVEEMYNLVLDDEISLKDFAIWCAKIS